MRHRILVATLMACLGGAGAGAVAGTYAANAAADPPLHPVLDPYYGAVLFEFYQGRYFPAITQLEVSQHFERLTHHADEAESLRGGLLLSYGLHEQAGAVFDGLIARGAPPSVRDRAWYFLAKIRYQRGLVDDANKALARIERPLPGTLEDDRRLLQANVDMALGDNAGAAAVLAPLAEQRDGDLYARFNLGVALIRGGDATRGVAMLDAIGRMYMPDEEGRALRDKANVAIGFAALRDGRPQDARNVLQRVRLQGVAANQALLGFGWAADALASPATALVPWQELADRDASDPSVLEAQLAVPYAYAKLGANAQALDRYRTALTRFANESAHIDATIAAIQQGRLIAGLLGRNPGEQMGWFQSVDDLPLMPHARQLTPVIAGNEFQEAFKSYRDLVYIAHNLDQWHDDLGVFADMLANRRQGFAERLPRVREQAGGIDIGHLQQRSDANAAALREAEAVADGAAFADADERALQARLARVDATLQRLQPAADPARADAGESRFGPAAELDTARERLHRVAGALAWRLAHEFPTRVWDAKKGQAQTEAALAVGRTRDATLAQAQRDEPVRFAAFAGRIAALGERLDKLMPRVASLKREQGQAVQDIAVVALQAQKVRLAGYAAQARFAVAQLYDRAGEKETGGKEGGHALQR